MQSSIAETGTAVKQNSKAMHRRHTLACLTVLVACTAGPCQAGKILPVLERPALPVVRPEQGVMLSITRVGRRLLASGERGLIILSDDSGNSWVQAKVPVSVSLTALCFKNDREGWAVGNLGVVLRTTDGGASWERVLDGRTAAALARQSAQAAWEVGKPNPSELEHPLKRAVVNAQRLVDEGADKPFLNLALTLDGTLHVVGAYGLAYTSVDAGRRWRARMDSLPNPDGLTLNGMVERKQEQFLYGEQGLLLHAAAPGQPFKAQALPSATSIFGAVSLRAGPLLLLGLRGKVFRSAQPGAPWIEVQTPVDATLLTGLELNDGTVLLAGAAGQLLSSTDQGQSYLALPMKTRFPFTGAVLAPDGTVVLAGTRGVLRLPADAMPPSQAKTAILISDRKESRDGKL
jgi:photosystem II stability/assembly factor-like uncharacterized protein